MDVEGMVAMVRALPDAGLTMSLMDGPRQYTLVPKNANVGDRRCQSASTYVQAGPNNSSNLVQAGSKSVATEPCPENKTMTGQHCHSAAQAVDGRYASVYQTTHCSVRPTSPPVQITEFPPQRAEPCKGKGNFVVGGLGSGECFNNTTKTTQSYRGAMNWPDRSVYTPRHSCHYEPDQFAHSLRKYPHLSPERSAEIVERLINYTTMKHSSSSTKNMSRCAMSPTRSESSNACVDRRCFVAASMRTKIYDTECCGKCKIDESPTRDMSKRIDCEPGEVKKTLFGRNYDVREVTRRAKESYKTISTYPYSHPMCPAIKERYDHLPPKNIIPEIGSAKSHMETQAEIPMASKEVTTMPREQSSTRNVAVPLSPSASYIEFSKTPDASNVAECEKANCSHMGIQTTCVTDSAPSRLKKSVQTCISSIDICRTNKNKVKNCRKTKSQQEISARNDIDDELLKIVKELTYNMDNNTGFAVRNGVLRKLKKTNKTDRGDKLKIKLGRCVRDQLNSHTDYKHFTKELSNELISKIKTSNMVLRCYGSAKVLRADIVPCAQSNSGDKCINELIEEWLSEIPVKQVDYLERQVKKEEVLKAVASKIKYLIMNKVHNDHCSALKPQLLDILDDVPIEVNARNKIGYLNRITHNLIKKMEEIFAVNATERKRWQKAIHLDKSLRSNSKKDSFAFKYNLPTDNDLKQFVKQEITDFTTKFHVKICSTTEKEIEIELVDILIDSFNDLRYGEEEKIKEEILIMLTEFIDISEHEGIYFVNNLIYNFKDLLKELHADNIMPQTFVVMRNTLQNSSNQTADISKQDNTTIDQDIRTNLDSYTQQLVQQIDDWMENIRGLSNVDAGHKRVVAHDLAGDIVDRHKYLELNPKSKGSAADELEYLKYQIFKWVNKLVGEDNLETIEQASQLMQKIQNIPVPVLTKPIHNIDSNRPKNYKELNKNDNKSKKDKPFRQGKISYEDSERLVKFEQRKQNSQSAIFSNKHEHHICYIPEVSTKSLGVMTCINQTEMEQGSCSQRPPIQRKTACTETELNLVPQMRPRSTSMTRMECPRAAELRQRDQYRRFSGPPGLYSGYVNARTGEQIPAPSRYIPEPPSRPHSPNKPTPLCCNPEIPNSTMEIKQLRKEYDKFLQDWVEKIPIITSKPEEQALISQMRKGIYNGVYKAITKLQMVPGEMPNRFYYQDFLDDELEELLGLLPESSELTKKKQAMKNQLIDTTVKTNEQICKIGPESSFKQQLLELFASNSPRKIVGFTADIEKAAEDIMKLHIAEAYILNTMYAHQADVVKANVYKKKLMKYFQEYLDTLKQNPQDKIDFETKKQAILSELYKVPTPSDETIREEGDEILIGLEIEQWFLDLPLYGTDSLPEMLCRKRYADTLAHTVHELEKKQDLTDCEDQLRHEIARFMSKLPIIEGKEESIPFMIEELVNRLKNRPKDIVEGQANRFANFADPPEYDEFSRHMPLCSSFLNDPGVRKAQANESSYMVRGGDRVEGPCSQFQYNQDPSQNTSHTPKQWYSLQEDGGHKKTSFQKAEGTDCCKLLDAVDVNVDGSGAMHSQLPRESYKRPDSVRDPSMIREIRNTPRMQDGPSASDQRSPGPPYETIPSPKRQDINSPPCCGQRSPDRRSGEPMETVPEHYMSRGPETHETGSKTTSPDRRLPNPRSDRYPADTSPSGFAANRPTAVFQPLEYCLNPNENKLNESLRRLERPGRSTYEQAPSTKQYGTEQCPGGSKQFTDGINPGFSGQPAGTSTPQDGVAPPRESRSKKRSRESRREAAKKRTDTDSDDDNFGEEVKCRCMERIWRCRKKRPTFPPCDECDYDFPPCFPMRFPPYPYYF